MPNSAWTETGAGIDLVPVTTPVTDAQQQSPDYLTNSDKIALMAQYSAELATKTQLDTTAGTLTTAGYAVSTTAYDNAVAAISTNLIAAGAPANWATIWPDGTTFGPVTGIKTSLGNWWSAVAQQRTILQGAISDAQAAQAKTAAILASQFHKVSWAYSAKPALPNSSYPAGYLALTTDNRTVQVSSDGTTWQDVLFSTAGLFGYIESGQIAAGAITADMITAGTMSADRIVFEPGGQSLNGTGLAEIQADCTANHIAVAGTSFPSVQVTMPYGTWETVATVTLHAQGTTDCFQIQANIVLGNGSFLVELDLDGSAVLTTGSITTGVNMVAVPYMFTGLAAGSHTITFKVQSLLNPSGSEMPAGKSYVSILQVVGFGAGFNYSPISGSTATKPAISTS